MITYCPTCNTDRDATVYKREETYPVKGEPITIIADVVVCNVCGDTIYDDELDGRNLERAYADYRKKHGLLSPEDIKQIRAKYGLSQRGISALLGWSPTTIARYETGAIPSRPVPVIGKKTRQISQIGWMKFLKVYKNVFDEKGRIICQLPNG